MRKKKYINSGKNKPADEFLKACRKVQSSEWTNSSAKPETLIDGALQAFREGRPENIQTALLHAKSLEGYRFRNLVSTILLKVSEESNDKLADINLALGKIPEEDRESVLSNALTKSIAKSIGDETFFALLWEAGASFDVALSIMHAESYDHDDINRVKFFQEKIAGNASAAQAMQPATESVLPAVLEIVQQMQAQMLVITAEVNRLKSQTPAEPAPPAASRLTPLRKATRNEPL